MDIAKSFLSLRVISGFFVEYINKIIVLMIKLVCESLQDFLLETTQLDPTLGGQINKDTHKLLTKDQNKDENELEGYEEEITESKDPDAKVRNRGTVVFPAGSKDVKDDKDHFPINSENQARNALGRAGQYSKTPPWFRGSLAQLKSRIQGAVKRKYPSIEVSK